MWKEIKRFFATKYRIVPVYSQDNEKCGFTVQKKIFLGQWMNAKVPTLEKARYENELLIFADGFFKTEEEASEFINRQKTSL